MPPDRRPDEPFATLPDPAGAGSLNDLIERLQLLKVWAGDPSYETIKERIDAAWTAAGRPAGELPGKTTVVDCFRPRRRRVNADLLVAVVEALHPDLGYAAQWRQALRVVVDKVEAASQVRVQDGLPGDLPGFTGRRDELDRLRAVLRHGTGAGGAVVISAIEGMGGVGKTQLAVHAGHLLHSEQPFDRVFFVNLRGFHPDPAQPPADPAAVLDGFLHLLGMPGHRIPYEPAARTAAYRDRLAGIRALVILDNAASAEQIRPLLPETPGCLTLVTSRRSLADLESATRLTVGAFTADEAMAYLSTAVPEVPAGPDQDAAARIARRCGHLPLALSLVTGHMRGMPGWTMTDHADRLDERHEQRRLESGVEIALSVSYQHLPEPQRRLLRLAALHPGDELDAYAVAALTGVAARTARTGLDALRADHLLQSAGPGRYTFHDLVRAFAATRAHDEERPAERRATLTRLFDHYLATTAAAMDTLYPAEAPLRPRIPAAGTDAPDLSGPEAALAWLDAERQTLVAVAVYTATHGWPAHTTRLARLLFRYLTGGHWTDAAVVHGHALGAARDSGDETAQRHALSDLGSAFQGLSRYGPAAEHLRQAADLCGRAGDPQGQARALGNLGIVEQRSGHYRESTGHFTQALEVFRRLGNRAAEARTLTNLGINEMLLGRQPAAADHYRQALALYRQTGDQVGEAHAMSGFGESEMRAGRYDAAGELLQQSLALFEQLGNREGKANTLDTLGSLHVRLGRPAEATGHYRQALVLARESGDRTTEVWVLNGLGEAARTAGDPASAVAHHTAAGAIAAEIGDRDQQARADAGLGRARRALGDHERAREHYERALAGYTGLGLPEADQIRTELARKPR